MRKFTHIFILAIPLLQLGGCGLFSEEDRTITATGQVILAETGAPLPGLSVALKDGGGLAAPPIRVLTGQTGSDGRFALRYEGASEHSGYDVYINDGPHDFLYTRRILAIQVGETRDFGVIEIELVGN